METGKQEYLLKEILIISEQLGGLGCGNHGCVINPPTGLATNGGCMCYPRQIARRLRHLVEYARMPTTED